MRLKAWWLAAISAMAVGYAALPVRAAQGPPAPAAPVPADLALDRPLPVDATVRTGQLGNGL